MITLLMWILSGMMVGCLVNVLIARIYEEEQPGEAQNVITGAIGAAIGGASYAQQFEPEALSAIGMLTALGGSVLLILLSKITRTRLA